MSNQAFRFTDKTIKDIKPTNKREYYHDTVESDLLLQVTPNGAKTFYIYKRMDGQPVRYKLGKTMDLSVKKAREEAIKIRGMVMSGVNPQKTRKDLRAEDTTELMFQKFMTEKKTQISNTTFNEYKRMWNKDLKPVFGNKKLSQISADSIKKFHKKFDYKPYYANRCINFLQGMFNYFIKEGTYKGDNPTKGIKLNKEEPRVRYMESQEIERFYNAMSEIDESVSRNAILMLLYTGVRKSNVLCMKWSEVDIDSKIWLIPRTKTGKNLTIALADSAVDLLKNIKSNNPDEKYVFPSATSASGHIVDIKRVWNTIKKKANITNLRIHDLRHTLATYMIAQGASPFIVQRTLTHKSIKSTQVYVNLGVEHLRDKLNETVNTLQQIGKKKGK